MLKIRILPREVKEIDPTDKYYNDKVAIFEAIEKINNWPIQREHRYSLHVNIEEKEFSVNSNLSGFDLTTTFSFEKYNAVEINYFKFFNRVFDMHERAITEFLTTKI